MQGQLKCPHTLQTYMPALSEAPANSCWLREFELTPRHCRLYTSPPPAPTNSPDHLWAHVQVRPRLARECGAVVRLCSRQPKVPKASHTRGIDEYVGGLDVAVQHGRVARLERREPSTNLWCRGCRWCVCVYC